MLQEVYLLHMNVHMFIFVYVVCLGISFYCLFLYFTFKVNFWNDVKVDLNLNIFMYVRTSTYKYNRNVLMSFIKR